MENRPYYNQYIKPLLYPNGAPAPTPVVTTPTPTPTPKVEVKPKVVNKPQATTTKKVETPKKSNESNIFTDFTSVVSNNMTNNITNVGNKISEGASNIAENVSNNVSSVAENIKYSVVSNWISAGIAIEDIQRFGKSLPDMLDRAATKYLGAAPSHTEVVKAGVTNIKADKVVTSTKDKTIETKQSYTITPMYKELATTSDNFLSYINIFDNNKGFDYIPTGRLDTHGKYKNVEGMAHFLFDYDMTTGISSNESNTVSMHNAVKRNVDGSIDKKSLAVTKAYNPGSTVTKSYFTIYTNNPDGTVNVKYKKADEVEKGDKLGDSLRQYRFTDIDWAGKGGYVEGFNAKTMVGLYTKSGSPTYFTYPKGATGKDMYGRWGGNSVIFLIENSNVAIDFAGSTNQIKQQGDAIVKQFNIKPEQLIIAYHDVGSFNAKIQDINGVIDSDRYYGFNDNKQTGAGLAFPKK